MKSAKRCALCTGGAAIALVQGLLLWFASQGAAMAQDASNDASYPDHPIRMIVPYSAGSASDVLARVTGDRLSQVMGQSVIVDIKPGASGVIGAQVAAAAPHDGYTFVLLNDATAALYPALLPTKPYDMRKDFSPLSYAGDVRMVLIVNASTPVKNVADLIALAKEKNGHLDYASGGYGSVQQVLMEIFMDAAGVKLSHVPYKGVVPAVTDVVAGRVPVIFASLTSVLPYIKSGSVRALAVTSEHRVEALPDVPTMTEAGIAGFPSEPWNAFFAPANVPAPVLARLSKALTEVLREPGVQAKLENIIAVRAGPPEELKQVLDRDIDRYGSLVKKVGMKID